MATKMAKTIASPSPRQCCRCCCALALPRIGASPLPPRSALPALSRPCTVNVTRIAPASRIIEARETSESAQRSRSLHRRRRHGGSSGVAVVAAASPSSSETEEARTTTKQKRRSRSRSRTRRLLPSLEDLRPQRDGDDDNNEATVSLSSSSSAAAAASTSSSSTNSVLSAVALIVGSSVGAGVLALPAVSAPAGFAPSAVALVGVWALLTAEALLIAEVNLALLGAKKRERRKSKRERRGSSRGGVGGMSEENEEDFSDEAIVTLREMAHETLGARGGHFVAAAYLALSYSLMVAYISKAGELVSSALDPLVSSSSSVTATAAATAAASSFSSVSPGTGAALFTAAMGLTLFGGTAAVDGANRAMTLSLLAAYAVIVAVGGAQAEWGALAERAVDWGAAPAAVPVILLSLVYHDLVPVVCAQLRGDAAKVRTALFVGSAAPLAMFILWDAVALALVGGESGLGLGGASSTTFVDPLATLISSGGGAVGAAVGAFSLLAIVTSCLGTALGLSSTLMAEIKGLVDTAGAKGEEKVKEAAAAAAAAKAAALTSSSSSSSTFASNPLLRALSTTLASFSDDDSSSEEEEEEEEKAELAAATSTAAIRVAAFALVLGPPLAASLANPGSFFGVLNAVGGYGMTALYGVLPPLMAWKLREQQEKEEEGEVDGAASEEAPPKQQKQLAPVLSSSSPPSPFSPPLLPGGRAALTALTTASVAVEVGRLADDLEGWKRAAGEGAAAATGAAGAASSSFATSSTAAASAISTAFEGFIAGGDAGEKLSSSVLAHVSELLAAILP